MGIKSKPVSAKTTVAKTVDAPTTAAKLSGTTALTSSVSIGRKFTIPGKNDFESIQFSALVTAPTYEEASAMVDEIMLAEAEKAGIQFVEIRDAGTADADDDGTDDADADDADADDADPDADDAEEGLDEETVLAMSLKDLKALIAENSLDTDPDDYKGKTKGLAKAVLAEILASQDDDADDADADADDADDDADADDADDADADDADADADDDTAQNEPYTRKELEAMKVADLEAIWDEWEIKGKKPTGAVPVVKKTYVNKIMAAQDA